MFGLNVTSDFRKEFRPSLRDALASAGAMGAALAVRYVGSSRGLFLAASLGAGLIGGLVPALLSAHLHPLADAASLSRAVAKLEKLESEQTADAEAVRTVAQANAALQARLDTLEKHMAKVERANLDTNPTGAVAPSDHAPLPPKRDDKHKPPKS
ncbi:MAG TPA: hypothetical protein VGL41_09720 [Roseiarcus sp.]|jgi:hypothetical protein